MLENTIPDDGPLCQLRVRDQGAGNVQIQMELADRRASDKSICGLRRKMRRPTDLLRYKLAMAMYVAPQASWANLKQ